MRCSSHARAPRDAATPWTAAGLGAVLLFLLCSTTSARFRLYLGLIAKPSQIREGEGEGEGEGEVRLWICGVAVLGGGCFFFSKNMGPSAIHIEDCT
jgi:hypothetical protein